MLRKEGREGGREEQGGEGKLELRGSCSLEGHRRRRGEDPLGKLERENSAHHRENVSAGMERTDQKTRVLSWLPY